MERASLFVMLITVVFPFYCLAQDGEEEAPRGNINSNRKYKNEVGLDIAPLQFVFGGSSAGYPSLFYRRHFTKSKEIKALSGVSITSYHAYRFRLGSNLTFESFNPPDIRTNWTGPIYYTSPYNRSLNGTTSYFVRVGKEKQFRSKHFELFYGYDIFFRYNHFYEYSLEIQFYSLTSPDYYSIQSRLDIP